MCKIERREIALETSTVFVSDRHDCPYSERYCTALPEYGESDQVSDLIAAAFDRRAERERLAALKRCRGRGRSGWRPLRIHDYRSGQPTISVEAEADAEEFASYADFDV